MGNVPKLRFPRFSGEWEEKTIGDYYKNLKTGSTPSRLIKEYFEGKNLWITSGELNYNYINNTIEKISDDAIPSSNLRVYPSGTFFIAITGLEAPGTRGRCAINAVPASTNQSCLAFYEEDRISTSFLFYWYLKYGIALYYKYAQGTKQQSFNNKIVEKFEISLPQKQEQEKIASFLSAVDKKIEKLEEKIALQEKYKKAMMQKLFSQEIRFKTDDGSDFPAWEESKLEEYSTKISSGKSKQSGIGQYNLYGSTGIIGKTNEYSHDGKFILIARVGANAGLIRIVNEQFGVTDNTLVVDLNECVIVDFIFYLLFKYNLNKLIFGSGQPLITGGQLKNLKLNFPLKQEQQKIANFLSSLDKKIEATKKQKQKAQEFKKGLLQQMFV